MAKKLLLYKVNEEATCLKCGNKGAIQQYGVHYPHGLKEEVDEFTSEFTRNMFEKHRNTPYTAHTMGFGGTIPYECMNCGNVGLIDFGGLEGYRMAFTTKKGDKEDEK